MYNKESFGKLWDESILSMQFQIRLLVSKKNPNMVAEINNYYRVKVLKDLWFSKTFSNDYNQFIWELKDANEKKYEEVQKYLFTNSTLITEDEESKLVRNIMFGGTAGTLLVGAIRKNPHLLIFSLSVAALAYFYNMRNQKLVIEQANEIVTEKMKAIGKEIESILSK